MRAKAQEESEPLFKPTTHRGIWCPVCRAFYLKKEDDPELKEHRDYQIVSKATIEFLEPEAKLLWKLEQAT